MSSRKEVLDALEKEKSNPNDYKDINEFTHDIWQIVEDFNYNYPEKHQLEQIYVVIRLGVDCLEKFGLPTK
jgi:hypothetical protein